MAKDTQLPRLRQSLRVWAAMLPAMLLGIAWIAGDWLNHRPPEYYLVDAGVFLACLLLMLGGYALVRRFARNAR
jgi:hypothetical protein